MKQCLYNIYVINNLFIITNDWNVGSVNSFALTIDITSGLDISPTCTCQQHWLKRECQLLGYILLFMFIHFESLLTAKLSLITWLSSEFFLQFERFYPQQIQMVNKTSSKTKLIGSNAEACRVNCNTLWCFTFPHSRQQTFGHKSVLCQFWAEEQAYSL